MVLTNTGLMVRLTRREHFNAAHRLFRPEYSDEKNLEVFGKCSNPNWHGHNYTLYITVEGEVDPETGFVANLKQLSQLIRDLVINQLDHKNINIEVGFMRGKLASTENLAIGIWEELAGPVAGLGTSLYAVRVEETENNAAEYLGNKTNNQ